MFVVITQQLIDAMEADLAAKESESAAFKYSPAAYNGHNLVSLMEEMLKKNNDAVTAYPVNLAGWKLGHMQNPVTYNDSNRPQPAFAWMVDDTGTVQQGPAQVCPVIPDPPAPLPPPSGVVSVGPYLRGNLWAALPNDTIPAGVLVTYQGHKLVKQVVATPFGNSQFYVEEVLS